MATKRKSTKGKGSKLEPDALAALFEASPPEGPLLYVKIPEPLSPIERYEKYEEPLDAALEKSQLGAVTGGGTMEVDSKVVHVGIDVSVTDVRAGVALVKSVLRRLQAPPGTVIEIEGQDADEEAPPVPVWD